MAVILEEELLPAQVSEDLNEEQEQWFKERMAVPKWARPYKPYPAVVIGLGWIDCEEGRYRNVLPYRTWINSV